MRFTLPIAGSITLVAVLGTTQPVHAQSDPSAIDLVVTAGRPLRVALDERVSLKSVGQVVTGTVVEPVYAYDRIVIPVGTRVRGHVAGIDSGSDTAADACVPRRQLLAAETCRPAVRHAPARRRARPAHWHGRRRRRAQRHTRSGRRREVCRQGIRAFRSRRKPPACRRARTANFDDWWISRCRQRNSRWATPWRRSSLSSSRAR